MHGPMADAPVEGNQTIPATPLSSPDGGSLPNQDFMLCCGERPVSIFRQGSLRSMDYAQQRKLKDLFTM